MKSKTWKIALMVAVAIVAYTVFTGLMLHNHTRTVNTHTRALNEVIDMLDRGNRIDSLLLAHLNGIYECLGVEIRPLEQDTTDADYIYSESNINSLKPSTTFYPIPPPAGYERRIKRSVNQNIIRR